MEYICSKSN